MSSSRKKIDYRIKTLIENCVITNHRALFVILGENGVNQIPILHNILMKIKPQADLDVLWTYKSELAFERKKKKSKAAKRRVKKQKIVSAGLKAADEDDPFETFLRQAKFRYCYYKETHKILGKTYGMAILQDFEAVTPNTLARTVETVVGGGLVIILLRTLTSIQQLHTIAMDVHSRYRTETSQNVIGRFNERLHLSLATCSNCLIIDDRLEVLPLSSSCLSVAPVPPKSGDNKFTEEELQLKKLKRDLMDGKDTELAGCLVKCCLTLDQAKAVLTCIDAIVDKSLSATVVMKAARGRGKSAALGLAMAAAVAFGYSNIFVTSPSPENLTTLFEFICKGLTVLKYEEHADYERVISTKTDHNKATVTVNIFKGHRQTIKYIEPTHSAELAQAELLCIDEAAAIPMPLLKKLLGPFLVFMSSTVDGYEGTGRLLSQKLIQDLQASSTIGKELDLRKIMDTLKSAKRIGPPLLSGRTLYEVTLTDSIRYANGDPIEKWLFSLLCLNISRSQLVSLSCPAPNRCRLYYVDRDALFSFSPESEEFLQQLISIFAASEYKHSPDDLQQLSDAPDHHLFCLLGPDANPARLSRLQIFCAIQVSLEGKIAKEAITSSIRCGIRSSGDLIPWTIEDQFGERGFASKSGARIVRIAQHPDFYDQGYGTRSLQLLEKYYEGKLEMESGAQISRAIEEKKMVIIDEHGVTCEKALTPLLRIECRQPEPLDYIGVSYGLSLTDLRFYKTLEMTPVYIDPVPNEMTGDHSCIMLKVLNKEEEEERSGEGGWLTSLWSDFRRRLIELLPLDYCHWTAALAYEVLDQPHAKILVSETLTTEFLNWEFTPYDLSRLERYSSLQADYLLVKDIVSRLSRIYFLGRLKKSLKNSQSKVLVGIGLQGKSTRTLIEEADLFKDGELGTEGKESQILAYFNQSMKILLECLNSIQNNAEMEEEEEEEEMDVEMQKEREKAFAKATHSIVSVPKRKEHKRKIMSEEPSYKRKGEKKKKRFKKQKH